MNRTINERKAVRVIGLSSLGNYLSLFLLLGGLHKRIFIMFAIGIITYMITMIYLFLGAYSLGWEYKRMDTEDDANVSGAEE